MTTLEALAATTPDGLVESRRPVLSVLASLLRNPLQAMPPEVYRERLVLATTGRRTSLYVCDPALIQEVLTRQAGRLGKATSSARCSAPPSVRAC